VAKPESRESLADFLQEREIFSFLLEEREGFEVSWWIEEIQHLQRFCYAKATTHVGNFGIN
jgi:hypothetical protein